MEVETKLVVDKLLSMLESDGVVDGYRVDEGGVWVRLDPLSFLRLNVKEVCDGCCL